MSLQEQMERLRGRHTRGADTLEYYLVHAKDMAYLRDLMAQDIEWAKSKGIEQITFHGVRVVESDLAQEGQPLGVVSYF